MRQTLKVAIGQYSITGQKEINQDFIGALIPKEPLLSTKGIAIAIADGISTSNVSQIASETAVSSFMHDYFCTSETWSVKKSAETVLQATNSWLFSQSRNSPNRFNKDKGYVCTFSALVIKSNIAHLFHSGDTRIFRLTANRLEQLTEDHTHQIDENNSYLTRALGINQKLDIDYRSLMVEVGDVFFLASDGVYEFVSESLVVEFITEHSDNLDLAAEKITQSALEAGSKDNLSTQLLRIEQLPDQQVDEIYQQVNHLPLPPQLQARMSFDGYEIERDIYISSRSHVYLAIDETTKQKVVIKTPSTEMRDNKQALENFLMEDWIAKRIDNAYVLKAITPNRKRHYLYLVSEYIEGQTLTQWMRDNPKPSVAVVRDIIEQIAKGLQAFHRQEMIHQDLRPANVMIDHSGTVKVIDFGSTKVAGLAEIRPEEDIRGTAQYTAPEYYIGHEGEFRSDVFSLGVICYQMFCGELPYGTSISKANTLSAQRKLTYSPLLNKRPDIPAWVDDAIKQSVHITPLKRYQVMSEFVSDLRRPNREFVNKTRPPILERDPVAFWQSVSVLLTLIILALLYWR